MEFWKNPLGEKEQRAKYKLSFIYHFFLITSNREYKEVKQFPNTLAKIIRRAIINKTITCRFLKNIQIKNNSFNECMEGSTLFLTRNNSSFFRSWDREHRHHNENCLVLEWSRDCSKANQGEFSLLSTLSLLDRLFKTHRFL